MMQQQGKASIAPQFGSYSNSLFYILNGGIKQVSFTPSML
jgi:hypothetical protein